MLHSLAFVLAPNKHVAGWLCYGVITLAALFPFVRTITGTRKNAIEAKRMKRHLADYLNTQG